MILKYTYKLNVSIHYFVRMEFSDDTLLIQKLFEASKLEWRSVEFVYKSTFSKLWRIGKMSPERSMWKNLMNKNVYRDILKVIMKGFDWEFNAVLFIPP